MTLKRKRITNAIVLVKQVRVTIKSEHTKNGMQVEKGDGEAGAACPSLKKSYITQEQTKNKHATQYMGTSKHRGKPWYPKRALPLPLPLRIERTSNENEASTNEQQTRTERKSSGNQAKIERTSNQHQSRIEPMPWLPGTVLSLCCGCPTRPLSRSMVPHRFKSTGLIRL